MTPVGNKNNNDDDDDDDVKVAMILIKMNKINFIEI